MSIPAVWPAGPGDGEPVSGRGRAAYRRKVRAIPRRGGEASSELSWFRSSHSTNEGSQCVEVAETTTAVLVRDSKDKSGPHLAFSPTAWEAFVTFAAGAEV
ncbi:DUF397 domain-containing protein [Kitasatospora sp. NPDC091335]|uniref:DUF397 domain-containing protein n=1 Tax=Kitasatospora sp. NPDC091335 TaxID=3364085 RepID=UPI003805CB79